MATKSIIGCVAGRGPRRACNLGSELRQPPPSLSPASKTGAVLRSPKPQTPRRMRRLQSAGHRSLGTQLPGSRPSLANRPRLPKQERQGASKCRPCGRSSSSGSGGWGTVSCGSAVRRAGAGEGKRRLRTTRPGIRPLEL